MSENDIFRCRVCGDYTPIDERRGECCFPCWQLEAVDEGLRSVRREQWKLVGILVLILVAILAGILIAGE